MGRCRTVSVRQCGLVVVVALVGASMWFAAPASAAAGGTKLWRAFYDAFSQDEPNASASSPDGTKVFVTGWSDAHAGQGRNYATVAYNSATGAQLWVANYTSTLSGAPVQYNDVAYAIAVSPDGTKVYVTGKSRGAFATIAYNASTRAVVWLRNYTAAGPATAIAVSPDGTKVFVTGSGTSANPSQPYDYATVAYNAVTGALLWFSTFNGTSNMNDHARAIAVTPDGSRVIMTGYNQLAPGDDEYVTIAYDATTGAQQWVSHFNPGPFGDQAHSIAMSPDGLFVAVTGGSGSEFATITYDTATGAQRWFTSYVGPSSDINTAVGVAVAPDATKVYVTGSSGSGIALTSDYSTVAYAADTGSTLWASAYDGPPHLKDFASALDVSGDGAKVVVTGASDGGPFVGPDYATVAYDTTTGAQLWVTRHNFLTLNSTDRAAAVTIVPGDHDAVVTGNHVSGGNEDFATAAIAL
jgi:DNA-binding beta-propeller fold protein YncE